MRYDRAQLKTPYQVSIITCLTTLGTEGINDLFSEVFNSNHAEKHTYGQNETVFVLLAI